MDNMYTGRKIAVFTDVYGLLAPLEAVIKDIKERDIKEIYSLGNCIGPMPNATFVFDTLNYYDVKMVSGFIEYIISYDFKGISGIDRNYLNEYYYLKNILGDKRVLTIKNMKPSYELILGGKKIALCSTFMDLRTHCETFFDIKKNINKSKIYNCLENINSTNEINNYIWYISSYLNESAYAKLVKDALKNPFLNGNKYDNFDFIITGSLGKEFSYKLKSTYLYSLNPMYLSKKNIEENKASYFILKEKTNNMGFDIEKVNVFIDKQNLKKLLMEDDNSSKKVRKLLNKIAI